MMLTDRYDLPLSTTSSVARDAYVEGCAAKLRAHPEAIEAFDRAIAEDPGFALAHAAKAHALLERGDGAAARASIATTNSLAGGISEREASHVAFFDVLLSGGGEAALSELRAHLNAWPRDAVVLATAAFTNGLIGSSGHAGQKRPGKAKRLERHRHSADGRGAAQGRAAGGLSRRPLSAAEHPRSSL